MSLEGVNVTIAVGGEIEPRPAHDSSRVGGHDLAEEFTMTGAGIDTMDGDGKLPCLVNEEPAAVGAPTHYVFVRLEAAHLLQVARLQRNQHRFAAGIDAEQPTPV